jgi:uncharacterized protein (DUF4415 family)
MTKNKTLMGKRKSGRRSSGAPAKGARPKSERAHSNKRKRGLALSAEERSKRNPVSMEEVMEFYKPIKKPITLRLDADVLAWFRRDGRRYQTRINGALRRVMEREIKAK